MGFEEFDGGPMLNMASTGNKLSDQITTPPLEIKDNSTNKVSSNPPQLPTDSKVDSSKLNAFSKMLQENNSPIAINEAKVKSEQNVADKLNHELNFGVNSNGDGLLGPVLKTKAYLKPLSETEEQPLQDTVQPALPVEPLQESGPAPLVSNKEITTESPV